MGGKAAVAGRGRKPKPVAIKKAAGNPGRRKLNEDQPQFPAITNIAAPEWIEGTAREMWDRVAPDLCRQGVLSMVDLHNLEAFCEAYSLWRLATDEIKKRGPVTTSFDGSEKKSPYATIVNECLRNMATFGALLGLDPGSRQRLTGNTKQKPKNQFSGLL